MAAPQIQLDYQSRDECTRLRMQRIHRFLKRLGIFGLVFLCVLALTLFGTPFIFALLPRQPKVWYFGHRPQYAVGPDDSFGIWIIRDQRVLATIPLQLLLPAIYGTCIWLFLRLRRKRNFKKSESGG